MDLQEKKHDKDYRIQGTGFKGTFKKTEYNLICKLLTYISFFNDQNSTSHSSYSFWSKQKGNFVAVMVGSLIAWIGVVMIK